MRAKAASMRRSGIAAWRSPGGSGSGSALLGPCTTIRWCSSMDEATSALDTKTESEVALSNPRTARSVTVIAIAHRLSTIRESDQVCFMRNGTIVAAGTFEEVVQAEPDFAEQAALAGLAEQR